MYCSNCGSEIDDKAVICPNCGVPIQNKIVSQNDTGGFGWGALGFFVPLVGLILYLVWKDEKPKTSKSVGMGALTSVLLIVALYALIFIVAIVAGMSGY